MRDNGSRDEMNPQRLLMFRDNNFCATPSERLTLSLLQSSISGILSLSVSCEVCRSGILYKVSV